ncbi:MAG: hypothetical protein WCK58_09070 [Chloroflexota bacterium]
MTYLFTYHGGGSMDVGEAELAEIMAQWNVWFGSLGDAVVDAGNPGGATKVVSADGVTDGGPTSPTGYSLVTAASLDAAVAIAKGCPALPAGGMVEVTEIIPAM